MKNKKLIFLVALLSLIIAILIGKTIFSPQTLKVIQTQPIPNQKNVPLALKEIVFTFDRDISSYSFTITSKPYLDYKLEKDQKKVLIKLKEKLQPQTNYHFILTAKNGFSFSLDFSTQKLVPTPSIATGRGDPNAYQETVEEITSKYPLFNQTPKKTENWIADYLAPHKLIVLYNPEIDIQTIKNEVFIWMEDQDVDPQTHQIIWQKKP